MKRILLGVILALALANRCDSQGTNAGSGSSATNGGAGQSSNGGAGQGTNGGTGQSTNGGTGKSTNGGAAQSTNGGAAKSTNGGTGQSTNGGAAQSTNGGAAQTTNGGAAQTTNVVTPTLIERPGFCGYYECQPFMQTSDEKTKSFERTYGDAKWLKIKKKPFTFDTKYYDEIEKYIIASGIQGAMPVVVRVDCPADHLQRWAIYKPIEESLYIERQNYAPADFQLQMRKAIQLEAKLNIAKAEYIKGFNMTVMNYLASDYQSSSAGVPPIQTLPAITDRNLSVVEQSTFTVKARTFASYYGTDFSHREAVALAKDLNMEFSTYYAINYFTGYFEIWLTPDPKAKLFA